MARLGTKRHLLTVADIRERYGFTQTQIRDHIARGNLRPKAYRMVFTDWEVDRWIREQRPRRKEWEAPKVEPELAAWEVQPRRVKFGE